MIICLYFQRMVCWILEFLVDFFLIIIRLNVSSHFFPDLTVSDEKTVKQFNCIVFTAPLFYVGFVQLPGCID